MARKRPGCAYCRTPIEFEGNAHAPFCSDKCRLLDFGKWMNEEYSLPTPITERDLGDLERALAMAEQK